MNANGTPLSPAGPDGAPQSGHTCQCGGERQTERGATVAPRGGIRKAFIIEQHVCYRRLIDASKLANYFRANSCVVTHDPEEADYLILFTCAVTASIEREGFQAIEKLSRYRGELIVMGCLPEIARSKFDAVFHGRSLPTRDMDRVDALFRDHAIPFAAIPEPYDKVEAFPPPCVPFETATASAGRPTLLKKLRRFSVSRVGAMRVRRFVRDRVVALLDRARGRDRNTYHFRIARGCKGHCTYCGIRFAIGPLRSRPLEECLRDYRELLAMGRRNFHILAEDVGAYGLDIGCTFADLLDRMSELDRGLDVRWQITEVNAVWAVKYRAALARAIRTGKLTALQIAQESGSPRILRRIKKYSLVEHIEAAITEFKQANSMVRLSGLFIVGFPSETEEEFQQTLEFIRRNYQDGVNLAPYSDREGTAASQFTEKIDGATIRTRLERAMEILDSDRITWSVSS